MEERSTEELTEITFESTPYWQQELIDQAKEELEDEINREAEKYEQWLASNAEKKYLPIEKIIIMFLSIFIVIGMIPYGKSTSRLKEDNYVIKHRQRPQLLIWGTFIRIIIILINFHYSEPEPLPDVDISAWEENYIPINPDR